MCPRSLIMDQAVYIGHSRAIITDRGNTPGTLGKHPFLNTFINQLEPLFMPHQVFENRIFRICLQ